MAPEPSSVSPVDAAAYSAIHDFKAGAQCLATQLGMPLSTLYNKVNSSIDSHQLTMREAISLMAITRDYRLLAAIAQTLGHVAIPVIESDVATGDAELLSLYARLHRQLGNFSGSIEDALRYGTISREDIKGIEHDFFEAITAGLTFISRMGEIADD